MDNRLDTGFRIARALGTPEGRAAFQRAGYRDSAPVPVPDLGGLERHLPDQDLAEMAAELATTPEAERPVVVAAWRSTAQAYADPELRAALARGRGARRWMGTIARVLRFPGSLAR